MTFKPAEWPSILYRPTEPMDWSTSGYLAIDVTNDGVSPETFGVRVDDDLSANGFNHSRQGMATIEAGKTATYVLAVGLDPKQYGMNGVPGPKNVRLIGASGAPGYSAKHIVAMQFFMHQPTKEARLTFANFRLLPGADMTGIVDEFGQYTKESWPGKLTSESDLAKRKTQEQADQMARPSLEDRDAYGGWKSGPQLKATGYFRTEKVDGRWWIVDPDGRIFFTLGCDVVNPALSTFITGRESLFTNLPKADGPFAPFFAHESTDHGGHHVEGQSFQFYAANLFRKYGKDWRKKRPGQIALLGIQYDR